MLAAAFAGLVGDFALDVALDAPMRGITALFGASGSGKTTVLRCVAGLQRLPGRLTVGDAVWQDERQFRAPHARAIGYVFQESSLFPHLSVRRNLDYGARRAVGGGPPSGLAFDEVVDLLGLAGLLERAPAALSGGERQRVAVGRALLSRPELLLMDEPLSALDQGARDEILSYFETLHDTLAIPVLYVSHDLAEVARLADRMVVLAAGRKVADGTMEAVLERLDLQPATGRFEAGVVLTARVADQDADFHLTRLDHHGQTMTIPAVDLPIGAEIRVRIRARDVALATRRPEDTSIRNILAGTVVEIRAEPETAFAETLIDIGGGRLRARVTRESVAALNLAPGVAVHALVKSISFDRRTTK